MTLKKLLLRPTVALFTFLLMIWQIPSSVEGSSQPPANGSYPKLTVISSDEEGMTLKVEFPDFKSSKVEVGGLVFDVLEIPGCGKISEIGKPALPRYGAMVSVPLDVVPYVCDIETEKTTHEDYLVYPAQEPAPDVVQEFYPPFPTPPFTMNEDFYKTDMLYPTNIVEHDPAGRIRDERVLPLRFVAFRHNPVKRELVFFSSITVRIGYDVYPVPEQPLTQEESQEQANGCEFLIITAPGLIDAANTLAARRNAQGLSTLVRTTTDTGSTADQIKAYIQNAYDTWTPRPSYLLHLGDAELIPTFYHTVHLSAGSYYPAGFHTGTDLYYAILNGPEGAPPYYDEYWTPDLFYGRIPADTLTQANNIINKIIEYEDNQWICNENSASVSGYFQDHFPTIDGFEDRRFILTSEEIRDFLLAEGFQVDRLYTTQSTVTPTNYNNGTYDAGIALPADLLRPTYPWNADTADITNSINDGRFLFVHRDHGGSRNRPSSSVEGWGDPEYQDTDVTALSNSNHYNVVFSINCETGWFDGETDDYTTRSFESLCEAFLREDDGGAVGVVGSTRISSSGWNDDLAKGLVDAIWPNFDPGQGPNSAQLRMGEVLNYAKLYMYNLGGGWPWNREKQQYEMFHYFGDPTMSFKIPLQNQPPVAICQDVTVEADENCQGNASIDNGSYDPDGDPITIVQSPAGPYNLGSTTVTLTVTDTCGVSDSCTATVTVVDTTPPSIESLAASPSTLWPPNHKMVSVSVDVSAFDNCDLPVCSITSVNSNEPVNGLGDGDTEPDWEITGNLTVNLRAERSGTGSGRVYTMNIECTDESGNSSVETVEVTVPHDKKK